MVATFELSDRRIEVSPSENVVTFAELADALATVLQQTKEADLNTNSVALAERFLQILIGTIPTIAMQPSGSEKLFAVRTLQEIADGDVTRKNAFLASPVMRGSETTWTLLVSAVQLVLEKKKLKN